MLYRLYLYNANQGRSQGVWGDAPQKSKCCLADWILSEICLECIILVTNFQKSPSAGRSPPRAPINLQYWWPECCVIFPNCGFSNWLWQNRTLKNQLWRYFSDVITIMSLKNTNQHNDIKSFHFPLPIKIDATLYHSHTQQRRRHWGVDWGEQSPYFSQRLFL